MTPTPDAWRQRASTPTEARDRYRRFIQRALSCLDARVFCRVFRPADNAVTLRTAVEPIQLNTAAGPSLYLLVLQGGFVVPDPRYRREWKISTARYTYAVYDRPDIEGAEALIRWHWNRDDPNWPAPHVHVAVPDPQGKGVDLHIPTGARVSIEQVVAFLIRDMGVTPAIPDWQDVLGDGQARFDAFQTQDPR